MAWRTRRSIGTETNGIQGYFLALLSCTCARYLGMHHHCHTAQARNVVGVKKTKVQWAESHSTGVVNTGADPGTDGTEHVGTGRR